MKMLNHDFSQKKKVAKDSIINKFSQVTILRSPQQIETILMFLFAYGWGILFVVFDWLWLVAGADLL